LTPICDAEQESHDEEIVNVGDSQESKVELASSEDATSEIQDPDPTGHSRTPKRKSG
jgi:hypothetical protein